MAEAEEKPSQAAFKTPVRPPLKRSFAHENTPNNSADSKALVIPPSPFLKKLGYGTGVSVYLMERSQTPSGKIKSPWAVKKLNSHCSKRSRDTFKKRMAHEAAVLKDIDHENIIGYRELVRGDDGQLCLCMESGEKSLNDMIEERRDADLGPFPVDVIYKVALSVAKALSYLHNDKKLLHGDLKSHNILIKGDNFEQVKLCDFGVCLKLTDDLSDLADPADCYTGSGPWCSREALDDGQITDRADIYSYGCVLFELLSLLIPHMPPQDDSMLEESFDEEAFQECLGTVPLLPELAYTPDYHPYIALMSICCREDPTKRPSAAEIVSTLQVLCDKDLLTDVSAAERQ